LFQDLDLAGDFVFADGILSHWQVWLAAAALTQYAAWRLNRHSRLAHKLVEPAASAARPQEKPAEEKPASTFAANV
jgi:hypothetical protein